MSRSAVPSIFSAAGFELELLDDEEDDGGGFDAGFSSGFFSSFFGGSVRSSPSSSFWAHALPAVSANSASSIRFKKSLRAFFSYPPAPFAHGSHWQNRGALYAHATCPSTSVRRAK